jgi:hypothetical protein
VIFIVGIHVPKAMLIAGGETCGAGTDDDHGGWGMLLLSVH